MGPRDAQGKWWQSGWWTALFGKRDSRARHDPPAEERVQPPVLRGVFRIADFDEVAVPPRFKATAFQPDERTAKTRADGCCEISVNWEDDDGALAELNARPDLKKIARIEHVDIQRLVAQQKLVGTVRSPTNTNPYHGDVLVKHDVPWALKLVAAGLAIHATPVEASTGPVAKGHTAKPDELRSAE